MTMKMLIESLKQATIPEATDGTADYAMADEDGSTGEVDGEDVDAVGDPAADAADAFPGWEEGLAVVALEDTEATGEDDSIYEIPANTTAEVVAVIADADPPAAVVVLDDGTEVAIELGNAGAWGVAGEGVDELADDDEMDDEGEEMEDDEDEEDMEEAVDPLIASLRGILDEARGKKGKKAPKGEKPAKGAKAAKGCAAQPVEEAEEIPPATQATLALVGVYGQLLSDALAAVGTADLGNLGTERVALEIRQLMRKARPAMRKAGVNPSLVQRLLPKVSARVALVVDNAIRNPEALPAE
jgi:hypothetical protein